MSKFLGSCLVLLFVLGTALKFRIIEIAMITDNTTLWMINIMLFMSGICWNNPTRKCISMYKIVRLTETHMINASQFAMILLTNIVASLKIFSQVDGKIELMILTCYLGWMGLIIQFIHNVGKMIQVLNNT